MKENGDPIDPILFGRLVEEHWEKLAGNAGLNLQQHRRGDEQSPEWMEREGFLKVLKMHARKELMAFLLSHGRWWIDDGDNWKRPPPKALLSRIVHSRPEMPWDQLIFVDRVEVEAHLANCGQQPSQSVTGKPGRPLGSGAYSDGDLLDEMRFMLKCGLVTSIKKAAEAVASKAKGASFEAKVKRLTRKYTAALNGS